MLANFLSIKEKSKITIQLDDDNFILNNNFFGSHSVVGKEIKVKLYKKENQWFNVYESLNVDKNLKIYPRGFLQKYRFQNIKISNTQNQLKLRHVMG